jgi:AraC-like DNA-binding protein
MSLKAAIMRGGTNLPAVHPGAFVMPPGMKIRYDLPTPALRPYVSGYAIYGATSPSAAVNWFLPAPAMITVLIQAGPVTIQTKDGVFGPLPRVNLYGPTTCAYRAVTHGGVQVGVGITPLGWVTMTGVSAVMLRDRVVDPRQVIGSAVPAALFSRLDALADERLIGPTLDEVLMPLFDRVTPKVLGVEALTRLLSTDGMIEVDEVAAELELSPATIRRIASEAFGMSPKVLMRRARFLRSFLAVLRAGHPMRYDAIDSSYFDSSHFLRDATHFLGTTPRRFMAGETTFLVASLRARAATLGAPLHALHR